MAHDMLVFVELNAVSSALNIGREALQPVERRYPNVRFEYLESSDELRNRIAEPDIVLCWRFPAEFYPRAPRLKAVFTPAAGHDWVADDPSGRVQVGHGTFHGTFIAESLVAMMLHFNDRRDLMHRKQRERVWARDAQMPRRRLGSQSVLFVGYGHIGRHCARLLGAFGCPMAGMQRTHSKGCDPETGVRYVTVERLLDEVAIADHVVLLLPGSEQTQGFFGVSALGAMRPSAYLYNFGRGTTVDQKALIDSLAGGRIAGAGLDVFAEEPLLPASPLWSMNNVLITPHSSCHYQEYGRLFAEELIPRIRTLL